MLKETEKPLIETADEHILSTILERVKNQTSNSVTLMAHGIFTDKHEKGRFDRLSNKLNLSGFDVLRFDFRGHGESPMESTTFTVLGALNDYLSALDWCFNEYDNVNVVGSSFGGSVVLLERLFNLKKKIRKIVLLNPVIDYQGTFTDAILDWGKEIFSKKHISELMEFGKSNIINDFIASKDFYIQLSILFPYLAIEKIDIPSLVFHGTKDDKVPISFAKKYFVGNVNVKLDVVEGAGHAFKEEVYENYVYYSAVDWVAK
jgi:pimeloyl-ACP methyl ester carboxylesterase